MVEAAQWVRCLHVSSDDLVGYLFSPAACIISTAINVFSVSAEEEREEVFQC